MIQLNCDGKLDFLSPEQKSKLNSKFRHPRGGIMPRELAISLGIKLTQADDILADLRLRGLCDNHLLIYHVCSEAPVGSRPFDIGYPPLPWVCSECERNVENYDEMSFDLMVLVKEPIEFI